MNRAKSEEERLAQEVIAQIRSWVFQKKKTSGGNFSPRVSVKFCGGCNPQIERGGLARLVQEDLKELVSWAPPDEGTDLLLAIHGCLTACADISEIRKETTDLLQVQGKEVRKIEPGREEQK